ncbi:salicylate hydroxylase [Penicillium mononematosum]|uniref:salicylate hydroxylase n=1 Tax=Penicillium mononematosum TaxID=268346 RepID=UPI0025482B14|nr:salicylate hydroxylase [Penicillium mononematosum]KAJ6186504.1 salicylate hydroxylase [Penicillium mononematosum]
MAEKLTVVIVGAGFCGLTAAVECKLKGMNPILLEAYPTSRTQGDVLDFMHNGGRHLNAWDNGSVGEKLLKSGVHTAKTLDYYSNKGELLLAEPWIFRDEHYHTQYAGHRGLQHQIISDYAQSIGVDMRFGPGFSVVEYIDTETETGVVTKDGSKVLGDVVLGCDGPRSLARTQVLGLPDNKVNSGYAIYRAWYELTDEHRKNPHIRKLCNPDQDQAAMLFGDNMHSFIYTWGNATQLAWVLTHKDEQDIGESWSFPGDLNEALKHISEGGFSETLKEVARNTPEGRLVDYKLVWRDPIDTWLSKSRKIAVMGDAAHCHLPTSAQGACQAVEDAVVMANCLEKSKGDVKLGLQVFERIRYNRSHVIHMSSILNRDVAHATTWTPELAAQFADTLSIPHDDWIVEYDCKADTDKNFDRLAEEVKSGKPGTLEELSLPAGGSFKPIPEQLKRKGEVLDTITIAEAKAVASIK